MLLQQEEQRPNGDQKKQEQEQEKECTQDRLCTIIIQLSGYLVQRREFETAIVLQERMLAVLGCTDLIESCLTELLCPDDDHGDLTPMSARQVEAFTRAAVVLLHTARIQLCAGDPRSASRLVDVVEVMVRRYGTTLRADLADVLTACVKLHRGLVMFSSNKENDAKDCFRATLHSIEHLLPTAAVATEKVRRRSLTNVVLTSSSVHAMLLTADDSTALLRSVALTTVNNLSVCLFHVGGIFEAIDMLEKYVRINPQLFLHPSVVHNLKTCYDVAYKPTRTSSKKAVLSRLVQMFHASR